MRHVGRSCFGLPGDSVIRAECKPVETGWGRPREGVPQPAQEPANKLFPRTLREAARTAKGDSLDLIRTCARRVLPIQRCSSFAEANIQTYNGHVKLHVRQIAAFLALSVGPSNAENWPQFRGPRGDGSSLESTRHTWQLVSKTALPGPGHSRVGRSRFPHRV